MITLLISHQVKLGVRHTFLAMYIVPVLVVLIRYFVAYDLVHQTKSVEDEPSFQRHIKMRLISAFTFPRYDFIIESYAMGNGMTLFESQIKSFQPKIKLPHNDDRNSCQLPD